MPRPNLSRQRRQKLLPVIARAFAEFGYRRTTTAELAKRCSVRENILYRLWPDKKAMFIAAIEYVYDQSAQTWDDVESRAGTEGGANAGAGRRLLEYESSHRGETGLYRIVFAGLSETDDPEISAALRRMYGRFQRFIRRRITAHRDANGDGNGSSPDAELSAWALVGLGTVANISRELSLIGDRRRRRLIADVGRVLLEGGGV